MGEFGLYSLRSADLFAEARREFARFYESANDRAILFGLLCKLSHLREAIEAQDGEAGRTFTECLKNEESYGSLRKLCDLAKHARPARDDPPRTASVLGARVGLMRCSDSLGQEYLLVDGRDLRVVLEEVLDTYRAYFQNE